jgi:hypothetical protein
MMIMINFVPPLASVLGQLHLLHHHQPVPLDTPGRAGGPGRAARRGAREWAAARLMKAQP